MTDTCGDRVVSLFRLWLSQLENFDHSNLLYPVLLLSLSSTFIKPCEPVLIFLFSAQDKKTES